MAQTSKISAATQTKLKQLMRDNAVSSLAGARPSSDPQIIQVYNNTGAIIPRFGIVGIGGVQILPTVSEVSFLANPVITGDLPNTTTHAAGKFVVCPKPIPIAGYGDAILCGVTICKVNVSDESHGFADVSAGVTANLISAASSSCQVLWKESGTGVKYAIVRYGGTGGGESTIWGRVVRTLQYADAEGTPPEGYAQYEVRLLSETVTEYTAQVWPAGTTKWKVSQDLVYVANVQTSATWVAEEWTLQDNINPRPLGQEDIESALITAPPDMRYFTPWFGINSIIPLIQRSYTEGGTTQLLYFIDLEMTRVRTASSGYSMMWNPTEHRAMAVFRDLT